MASLHTYTPFRSIPPTPRTLRYALTGPTRLSTPLLWQLPSLSMPFIPALSILTLSILALCSNQADQAADGAQPRIWARAGTEATSPRRPSPASLPSASTASTACSRRGMRNSQNSHNRHNSHNSHNSHNPQQPQTTTQPEQPQTAASSFVRFGPADAPRCMAAAAGIRHRASEATSEPL